MLKISETAESLVEQNRQAVAIVLALFFEKLRRYASLTNRGIAYPF